MSREEEEKRKREIFESMSPRRQQRILKKGYEKWDPFLAPKEPPFFGSRGKKGPDEGEDLLKRFLRDRAGMTPEQDALGAAYVQGAREICLGLLRGEERYQAMLDFCRWLDRGLHEQGEPS